MLEVAVFAGVEGDAAHGVVGHVKDIGGNRDAFEPFGGKKVLVPELEFGVLFCQLVDFFAQFADAEVGFDGLVLHKAAKNDGPVDFGEHGGDAEVEVGGDFWRIGQKSRV